MYDYDDKIVTSTGDWGCPEDYGFSTGFFVRMEKATIEVKESKFTLCTDEEGKQELELSKESAYLREIADFVSIIKNNTVSEINPPDSSLKAIRIALAEKESALKGQTVTLK